MEIKKPSSTGTILLTLLVISVAVWVWFQYSTDRYYEAEYKRCDQYSSYDGHNTTACKTAGCRPGSRSDWRCIPL